MCRCDVRVIFLPVSPRLSTKRYERLVYFIVFVGTTLTTKLKFTKRFRQNLHKQEDHELHFDSREDSGPWLDPRSRATSLSLESTVLY